MSGKKSVYPNFHFAGKIHDCQLYALTKLSPGENFHVYSILSSVIIMYQYKHRLKTMYTGLEMDKFHETIPRIPEVVVSTDYYSHA